MSNNQVATAMVARGINVIGRAFGVSGTTAGKLIRKYAAEAGL